MYKPYFDVRMEHEVKKIDQRVCLDRAPRSPTIIRFLRRIFKIEAWGVDHASVAQMGGGL